LWGNAILTRGQALEVQTTHFRTTENLRRGAIAVRLATPHGSVWVASTHLDDPRGATDVRLVQIEELLVFLQSRRPLVLGGDFNAEPGSPEYQRLVEAGVIDAAATIGATGPTSADQRRIDYIFVTGEFTVSGGRVPSATTSDHRPVVVQLTLR
jgi:endonuclease/exonuclease/phosphatase family metal-dependent hydrolase